MCDETPDSEWTPFYLMNLNRFPWINNDRTVYGQLEYCPNCTETRIRIIDPREMSVVRGGSTETPTVNENESSDSSSWDDGTSGRDLNSPGDV